MTAAPAPTPIITVDGLAKHFPVRGGTSGRHRSVASGQRGARVQPGGMARSEGTMPGISASRRRTVDSLSEEPSSGTEPIRPTV